MRDNIPDPAFFSAEESPIPVPPIEESWSLMQQKLDDTGSARGGWWKWFVFAAVIAVSMLAWVTMRDLSVHSRGVLARGGGGQSAAALRSPGDFAAGRNYNRQTYPTHLPASAPGAPRENQPGAPAADYPVLASSYPVRAADYPVLAADSSVLAAVGPSAPMPVFPYPFPADADSGFSLPYPLRQLVAGDDPGGVAGKTTPAEKTSAAGKAAARRKTRTPQEGLLMAAGLSLVQNAPLGDQLIYAYNINGKSNLLSDYIPAPYLQYFLRKNLYLQAAFQFNSPQYTPSVVIDSPRTEPKNNLTVFTTSTLQKLYYTNLPVTVDYSPVAHLFLGTGLQYSGLRGGFVYQRVVSYDAASLLPIAYRTGTLSKPMEQALQLRKVDWRILFEANYYLGKVTLGLRYQQPLSSFSKKDSSGVSGPEKNTSLGFYLQYNLWERKRKN